MSLETPGINKQEEKGNLLSKEGGVRFNKYFLRENLKKTEYISFKIAELYRSNILEK